MHTKITAIHLLTCIQIYRNIFLFFPLIYEKENIFKMKTHSFILKA